MVQKYSNIPSEKTSNATLKGFEKYTSSPLELNSSVFAAMKGYFTNHGFGDVSAESITITLMSQAQSDGYNPMQILDSLRGLSNVELSALVSEILNYNRYKSSSLGFAAPITKNLTVSRNVLETGTGSTTVIATKYTVKALNNFSTSITTIDKSLPVHSTEFTYVKFIVDANVPNGTKVFWDLENGYFYDGTTVLRSGDTLIYNKVGVVNNQFPMDFHFDNVKLTDLSQNIKFNLRIGSPTGKIVATTTFNITKGVAYDVDYLVFDTIITDGDDMDTSTGIYPAIGSSNDKMWASEAAPYYGARYVNGYRVLELIFGTLDNLYVASTLLEVQNLNKAYPNATHFEIDHKAAWGIHQGSYQVGVDPVYFNITGYKGGIPLSTGHWVGPIETKINIYELTTTVTSQEEYTDYDLLKGQGILRMYYSILDKQLLVVPWNPIWDEVVTGDTLTDENDLVLTDENGDPLTTSDSAIPAGAVLDENGQVLTDENGAALTE